MAPRVKWPMPSARLACECWLAPVILGGSKLYCIAPCWRPFRHCNWEQMGYSRAGTDTIPMAPVLAGMGIAYAHGWRS